LKFIFKNKYLISISLVIIFFISYWLKLQIGINIFSSVSIGSYFPFKYLSNNVIESTAPGILLSEDFDRKTLFRTFSKVWMGEKGTVTKKMSPNGFKGSRCFFVTNVGTGSWVSSHRKIVKVSNGDLFYMEGLTKMTGDTCRAHISVAAFDNNKDVINWNLLGSETDRKGEWIKLEKQFVIPDDNIKFIRFRLVGVGKGEYLFDNIILRKLNFSEQNDQP
jgi:hypothetical protein